MKLGKKGKANKKNNAELKKLFEQLGIRWCEKCGATIGLTWAHSKKRRFCVTDADMKEVALMCLNCHIKIEQMPPADMYREVIQIIENRNLAI